MPHAHTTTDGTSYKVYGPSKGQYTASIQTESRWSKLKALSRDDPLSSLAALVGCAAAALPAETRAVQQGEQPMDVEVPTIEIGRHEVSGLQDVDTRDSPKLCLRTHILQCTNE